MNLSFHLDDLRLFCLAARRASFAATAKELGTSPAFVSKRIAILEKALGVSLFHRASRRVTVNPDGSLVRGPNGVPTLGERLRPDQVLALPISPDPREIVDAGIDPMFEQEIVLGYEHQFDGGPFDGWRAGVRYVNRDLKSTIEDTDLGRGGVIDRFCARTHQAGCNVVGADGSTANDRFSGSYILLNPGKGIPTLARCAEYGRMHVHGGRMRFPELPRF